MADTHPTLELTVDGLTITALTAGPTNDNSRPLIVALHGGTYTGRYFDVAGSPEGSFLDTAAKAGYRVVAFDRPGYGGSTPLEPADNTFERHAELLDKAIAQVVESYGADRVFVVAHSIGGMIATTIAANGPSFPLIGLSLTGVGAVLNSNGSADALAALPPDATIDLPYENRDQVMFGPAGTFSPEGVAAAHASYAPVPVRELINAPQWPREKLAALAPKVQVPVHHAIAEFDALWDGAPDKVAEFPALLVNAPFVQSAVARGVGHSIDHHLLGHALHLRQLAFVEESAAWAEQR